MTFAPGTLLGCYEIVAPLGSGGMGEVYRGRDTRLGRQVAIKVLAKQLAGDPKAQARFEREVRAVAALSHPNILALFDYGESDGTTFAILELLEGETLRARLAAGPLPRRKALDYAVHIARGLAAAHDRGILHRDLKPENVFLTRDGQVKILDFGLALLTTPDSEAETLEGPALTRITDSGFVVGTAGYMSPEQVRGLPADHRSDLFSFGTVLYEMLAGRRAFSGETPSDRLIAVLQQEPPELPASVPRALDRIVRHCLEKRPEERFQSARDLAFDLEALTDLATGTREAPPPALQSRPRRARLLLAGLLLVAATAGAGLARWLWRDPPSSPPIFRQLTFRRGSIHTARFAPDGETIVYGAAWEGKPLQIFTMRADRPEASPLPLPSADLLAVSRSGEIALSLGRYFLGSPFLSLGTLASTPLAGGAPREILDGVHQADWAPDGSGLAVVRLDGLGRETRLEYPIGRLLQRSVSYIMDPRVSPTGDRVAVFESRSGGFEYRLAVFDRAGRREMSLPLKGVPFGLAWHPAGEEIWLSLWGPEGSSLQAVRLDGETRLVSRTMGLTHLYDISPGGKVLLGNHLGGNGMAGRAPGESRERDLSWLQVSLVRDLSADGRTLLFDEVGETAGGGRGSYLRRLDGSPPMHLGPGTARLLSPDGRWFLSRNADSLALLPTGAGNPRPLQTHLLDTTGACSWFPDGRRILLSGREPGSRADAKRLYVQDVAGGRPRAVTPPGVGFLGTIFAVRPLSPDGRQVAALTPDGKLWIYSLEGGKPHAVTGLAPGDAFLRWHADGRSLFVWRRDAGSSALVFRLDLATGTREPWLEVRPPDPAGIYTFTSLVLTPDGKSYAYDYGRMISELYLVEGLR